MIPFTQHVRPHNELRSCEVERSSEIEIEAARFIESGGSFHAEVLPGGTVALTAEHEREPDRDVATVLVDNGPEVLAAVDKLVARAVEWLDKVQP